MRHLLFISLFFLSLVSSAQSFEKVEDAIDLEYFHRYVQSYLNTTPDTVFVPSPNDKYFIQYKTSCPYSESIFIEPQTGWSGGKRFQFQYANHLHLCTEVPMVNTDTASHQLGFGNTSTDTNQITSALPSLYFWSLGTSTPPKILSFNNGQFLILEYSYVFQYGNATNWGSTETLFLKREEK